MLRNVPRANIKACRGRLGVFCCVVGLYPDNLQEAWGSGRERLINIADSSFIHRPIPAGTSGSYVFTQEQCHARVDEGLKLLAPA